MLNSKYKIPNEVLEILTGLIDAGFKAYLVGGCVRDLILNRDPKDWDITTDATPEDIQTIFIDSFYENSFGTVGVKTRSETDNLKVVEVTPFRLESKYSDNRHPDSVKFSKKIEDDLKRRDFTINALALSSGKLVDNFDGEGDLKNKLIRAVGDPDERFQEDALRMLRAVRLACELDFAIETNTANAICANSNLLANISKERIRDEFVKIINSKNPMVGLLMAEKLALLSHILPVIRETIGVNQNKEAHKYDVWEHSLRSLQHAADKNYLFEIRLAALFHDIAKPQTKRTSGNQTTFYGHEVVGAKMTEKALRDLHFDNDTIGTVTKLVRWHMFFADPEEITLTAVRRMIARVGEKDIWNLMNLRICDRIGTGRPKEEPYRFRKYKSMVDEALRDPISVGMLKIDGNTLINDLKIAEGPRIGFILHALFEEVLEDPLRNTDDYLKERALELGKLDLNELKTLGEKGKEKLKKEEEEALKDIRKKHFVD